MLPVNAVKQTMETADDHRSIGPLPHVYELPGFLNPFEEQDKLWTRCSIRREPEFLPQWAYGRGDLYDANVSNQVSSLAQSTGRIRDRRSVTVRRSWFDCGSISLVLAGFSRFSSIHCDGVELFSRRYGHRSIFDYLVVSPRPLVRSCSSLLACA